ncbi:hypothetical protein FQR65_LT20435 [Abscondita terminalis]|nr:hypothetical protein FQR65_LT20435 [Abscondita terminalis]
MALWRWPTISTCAGTSCCLRLPAVAQVAAHGPMPLGGPAQTLARREVLTRLAVGFAMARSSGALAMPMPRPSGEGAHDEARPQCRPPALAPTKGVATHRGHDLNLKMARMRRVKGMEAEEPAAIIPTPDGGCGLLKREHARRLFWTRWCAGDAVALGAQEQKHTVWATGPAWRGTVVQDALAGSAPVTPPDSPLETPP